MLGAFVFAATVFIEPFPQKIKTGELLELIPRANHHFNLKAPQNCGSGIMLVKTEKLIRCRFKKPGLYEVRLSVCDDRKSFCKFEKLSIEVW